MNKKEILEKIQSCKTSEDIMRLRSELKTVNIGFSFVENRAFVRVDLRQELLDFCEKNDISLFQISKLIGFDYTNLKHFTKNRRGLPMDKVEEIIALMKL